MLCSSASPKKRKHNEYYDPDYVRPCPKKKLRVENTNILLNETFSNTDSKLDMICNYIFREFQNEISLKQDELAEIEKRLEKSRTLLDRLRYVIVSEFYQKQNLVLAASDVTAVRGNETLFGYNLHAPLMELHPSVKNIAAKKTFSHSETLCRPIPERAAAQNALNTIRARSQSKIPQSLVIDRFKQANVQVAKAVSVHNQKNSLVVPQGVLRSISVMTENKFIKKTRALNASRLNNKRKQIIAIGNTSTYIGAESGGVDKKKPEAADLTHKWIVYVQSKDTTIPIESFIKKVRFHLHPSYRPNDIVDIRIPPFQIARRGWGEFPIRIQMFFHDHLQQKSVQLIHNLVLDRTLSGMHTLGAETLMEMWLRKDAIINKSKQGDQLRHVITEANESKKGSIFNKESTLNISSQNIDINTDPPTTQVNSTKKPRPIYFIRNKAELGDNLFGFLNKSGVVSADNMKIQPSVGVDETHLEVSSSRRINIMCKSPQRTECTPEINFTTQNYISQKNIRIDIRDPPAFESNMIKDLIFSSEGTMKNGPSSMNPTYDNTQEQDTLPFLSTLQKQYNTKTIQLNTPRLIALPVSNGASFQKTTHNKTKIIALSRIGKLMPLKIDSVAKMISPNAKYTATNIPDTTGNDVLQKKLVQLVDAEGKIKFKQALMAITQKPPIPTSNAGMTDIIKKEEVVSVQNTVSISPSSSKSSTTMTDTVKDVATPRLISSHNENQFQSASSIPQTKMAGYPKQTVFQKEGKLFIIDPLQMKLKQERGKQVSLLKPQSHMQRQRQQEAHKQKMQLKAFRSIISDHDYTLSLNLKNGDAPVPREMGARIPERGTDTMESNAFELLQQRRIQFEKEFLAQNVPSMRSAVDYILRRLPLIAMKKTLAAAFSFVHHSFEEFDALPVLKQRSCEWLRAKYITRFVRNHKQFQGLYSKSRERFWSTREVLVYARHHVFAPKMKSFDGAWCLLQPQTLNFSARGNPPQELRCIEPNKYYYQQGQEFSQFVKKEVRFEQESFKYESVTHIYRITSWIDEIWQTFLVLEANAKHTAWTIDVVSIPESRSRKATHIASLQLKHTDRCRKKQQLYIPIPEHLEEYSLLVSEICRDLEIQLQSEQVENDVLFPLAQAVITHCLKMFIEKLLRHTVASKHNHTITGILDITTQDIGKVLIRNSEFDFLTNKHFGTYKYDSENVK
ncbi:PREDICTED: uncharacterized protein LOC108362602 isoform X2 [Rhagoletis zephyria]|nr:PREDICTED: uncharacterized protein LOC108362602 isoform X2 [Rhagoletis zephyria]XP_017471133.1 PREDICTED: uncharacterized protein LOC108362602 isoform X2 [Rhagoletis zephyria]XP_017471134.1 PREDICTED: uncharacterized protein LOC108362602 isoform X2 [Rhagoletis zephyria]XP_017471135.1 PREDICTED: uncharacterized protein LOC108362602 isoform X2 [Rhagoletis zephyria]XP_017471136.1 PREDICTED: uncharacterized protein LOC108362602 isoform X2 [Rhagoletis zephyria]XP_017471137.1 PREDICTED: uncharact